MFGDVISVVRQLEAAHRSAQYAWKQYQVAYSRKEKDAAAMHRESVIRYEAEKGALMQSLHILTRGAGHRHMWEIEERLGKAEQ